jgi:exonuclease III
VRIATFNVNDIRSTVESDLKARIIGRIGSTSTRMPMHG